MLDTTSLALGFLGGAALVGLSAWLLSRWLQSRRPFISSTPGSVDQAFLAQQIASSTAAALDQSSRHFLELAKTELDGQFGREREALTGAVAPLRDSLSQVQGLVNKIEESRNQAYGSLGTELKSLMAATASLQHETTTLSSALKNPRATGRWGEVALRRLVELAGMTDHCDFQTQVSFPNMEERLRPDMIIYLPSGRVIPIDSKVSIEAYLNAVDPRPGQDSQSLFKKHSELVGQRLRELSGKDYAEKIQAIGRAPEFTVMFIPGDDFLAAALSVNPELFEEGASKKVMLASPTILLPMLRVVEAGWQQERFRENIEKLREEARTLYRSTGWTHRSPW